MDCTDKTLDMLMTTQDLPTPPSRPEEPVDTAPTEAKVLPLTPAQRAAEEHAEDSGLPPEVPIEPAELALMLQCMAEVQCFEARLGRIQADYEQRKAESMELLNQAETRRNAILDAITIRHLGPHRGDYDFDPTKRAFTRRR